MGGACVNMTTGLARERRGAEVRKERFGQGRRQELSWQLILQGEAGSSASLRARFAPCTTLADGDGSMFPASPHLLVLVLLQLCFNPCQLRLIDVHLVVAVGVGAVAHRGHADRHHGAQISRPVVGLLEHLWGKG